MSLFDFENARGIFQNVHRSYKFCLLTIQNAGLTNKLKATFAFFLHDAREIDDASRHLKISAEEIAILNPETNTCPILRQRADLELLLASHKRGLTIESSAWQGFYIRLIHLSDHAQAIATANDLPVEFESTFSRVYEAKLFHHFNHRYATFSGVDREAALIESHKTLLSDRGKLARQIDLKRAVQAESLQELLGLLPEGLQEFEGELLAAQAITYASTRRVKAEKSLANEMTLDSLHDWRKSNDELQQDIGRLRAKIGHEETDIKEAETFLKSVDDGSYKKQLLANADMGVYCHLFNTESEAISKGCPGSTARIAPKYDPDLERMKAEKQPIIDACQSRLNSLRMELAQKESLVATSEAAYTEAQTAAEAVRQPLRDTINEMRILEITAKRYQRVCEELSQLVNSQDAFPASIRASLEQRRKADQRYKKNRKTITECFIEALFRITGSRFDASIEINAHGIHPRLGAGFQSSGEAVGTSTVLAFDLACMMASMRSIGNHPRFLLDDSPRDADIEPQLYQRFLQSIADLEQLTPDSEAAFQYILTTTTRPEGALVEKPYLRLTLDRIKPENMLFGVRF